MFFFNKNDNLHYYFKCIAKLGTHDPKAKIPFVRVRSDNGNLPPAIIRQFLTTFLGQDSICTLTVRFSNPIFTRF